jgi:hypothetical protein
LLTLLAIPVLYSFFDDFGQIFQQGFKKNANTAIEVDSMPATVTTVNSPEKA